MTSSSTSTPTPGPTTASTHESVPGPLVVVGVDGSAASDRALLAAGAEAQRRGAVLEIVAAHDFLSAGYGYTAGLSFVPYEDGLREAAETLVKSSADKVAVELPGPPVHVVTLVEQGRPSQVLLRAAEGADLLVVGTRGAGAFTRLMMGSTSTEVLHHASLPVLVVPSAEVESAHQQPVPERAS